MSFASFGFSNAQLPDLIVSTGGFSPTIIDRGDFLTITTTLQNTGIANSSQSHLAFYISKTTTVTDGYRIGCVSVEPLAGGSNSETKQIVIPIPTSLIEGNYYVGWKVDPYNEVAESDESNGFYLPNNQLTLTNNFVFSRHIPYPIIFIHGLKSNDQTWDSLTSQLDYYGWSFGGRMDYCLNYDSDLTTSLLPNDIHDFTTTNTLNSGDYYTINFDVNTNGAIYNDTVQSNQAAIVKQGKALQAAIGHVLNKTGSDKVILVGHSMGGLASREYLQNSSFWQTDGRHHVAKLLTIGTPHGGSNQWTFGILDGYSEAVRDLRWSYSNGFPGVYLFGGNENNLDPIAFHNYDVNCNAEIGDSIVGLNQKNISSDLVFSCVIGIGGLSGDGVVDAIRADLNNYYLLNADTFLVNAYHTNLPKEITTDLKGLDEPTYFNQSYQIGMDTLYYGLITTQSKANPFINDYDDYSIYLNTNTLLNIKAINIPVPQFSIAIFDTTYALKFIKFSNALSQIDTTVLLSSGKYYLEIEAQPDSFSWMFPYAFTLHGTPMTSVESNLTLVSQSYRLEQNFPNPFNPSTTISYRLPTQCQVTLKVFDVLGREVATLVSQVEEPGYKSVNFDASGLSSGMYYYRLQAGNFVETKKLLLMK